MSRPWPRSPAPRRRLSPRGMLSWAVVLLVVFAALHLGGAREYTAIFSGTSPTGSVPSGVDRALGGLYAVFYLAAVVLVPILVLGAVSLWGLIALYLRARKK